MNETFTDYVLEMPPQKKLNVRSKKTDSFILLNVYYEDILAYFQVQHAVVTVAPLVQGRIKMTVTSPDGRSAEYWAE